MGQLESLFFLFLGVLGLASGEMYISSGEASATNDEYLVQASMARALSLFWILGSLMMLG